MCDHLPWFADPAHTHYMLKRDEHDHHEGFRRRIVPYSWPPNINVGATCYAVVVAYARMADNSPPAAAAAPEAACLLSDD